MSNYTIAVNWSGKDALADTDAAKVISGADFNTEFVAVRTSLNSKADVNGSASENFTVNGLTATTGTIDGEEIVTLASPQTFTKAHPTASETITLASTQTANLLNADVFVVSVQGNHTLNVSNMTSGVEASFLIKNTGAYDITFSTDFSFIGGHNPTITSGNGKVDLVRCVSDGTKMYCNIAQNLT
jgi:hypothetical protein|tara:strand:- start:55 stop:612 length:558 start_codon:yes stop_codon:yes gene_type:complete